MAKCAICEKGAHFGNNVSHSHRHDPMRRNLCDISSFKHNRTFFWRKKSCDCMKCCCLSGSVCADQCNNLSLIYLKGNAFDCLDHSIIYF